MFIYIYTCLYICICIYTSTYTYVYIYAYINEDFFSCERAAKKVYIYCVHYLCLIGWVYMFYVGHVDNSSLYETLFHCNIQNKYYHHHHHHTYWEIFLQLFLCRTCLICILMDLYIYIFTNKAYKASGLTAKDIDYFGLYDCFPICFIKALEGVGLAAPNSGGRWLL
jgi:hypothetical protein